ncbi:MULTISPECIES: GNAT family N-acetyltransferase [Aeromonas]|uniref:GNAT family N-acetyltransferase n=1 Tax=Aeromonas TaxID=642 RepID=UPI0005A7F1BE|nr:GNAT family N-acetyltransferase [Aeromonas caviae]MBS4635737.1 GNAT family N-acetyltransferase [Aeromonas caviae]MCX4032666.1 GNAT family N-acetyltransferase [Aeromonas caviae]WQD90949.1 GNAT family N-acetyltransferase [Aeromonas caviae]SQH59488.1 GMP synthase [Aeromonas caviae]
MKIDAAQKCDHPTLITIWEASVRASHHFLQEADIAALRPLILEHYFDAVTLNCARVDNGVIVGFIGVAEGNIEMLFVDPGRQGGGVGRLLVADAIHHLGATRVDVNEQNEPALGFYRHLGFEVVGRSALDGQGKPYPLLHLVLSAEAGA